MPAKTKLKKYEAKVTFVGVDGARPVEYRKEIVRDRKTGQLAEVALTEFPPIAEAVEGTTYVASKGEQFYADEPIVKLWPHYFVEVEG